MFLIVPNRNVLLTQARWGVGNGPTPDDAERARPAGCAEENQEEANYATRSCGRDGRQRAAGAADAKGAQRARRQGGSACRARAQIEPKDCRRGAVQSRRDPEPGRVSRIWTDVGGRILGQAPRHACEPRNGARLDGGSQVVASKAEARRQSAYLASTAQPLRRTGAMGHQRARLAGRPRPRGCI